MCSYSMFVNNFVTSLSNCSCIFTCLAPTKIIFNNYILTKSKNKLKLKMFVFVSEYSEPDNCELLLGKIILFLRLLYSSGLSDHPSVELRTTVNIYYVTNGL